jgi:hypothetical protein
MTDIKLLELLDLYSAAQRNVVAYMLCAMEAHEEKEHVWMWDALFYWCEAKDRREELWDQLKSDFPRAMMLKEGVSDD